MAEMLARLKIDLGIMSSTVYDTRLTSLLQTAQKEIEREGAELDIENSIDDQELVIDYARELWLIRRETGSSVVPSRTLRWRINNRIFGKKTGGDS